LFCFVLGHESSLNYSWRGASLHCKKDEKFGDSEFFERHRKLDRWRGTWGEKIGSICLGCQESEGHVGDEADKVSRRTLSVCSLWGIRRWSTGASIMCVIRPDRGWDLVIVLCCLDAFGT